MKHLIKHFNNLTLHPKNAKALKGLILQLAVQGKLTENWRTEHPDVESGMVLLEKIIKEKNRLIKEKKLRKEKSILIKKEKVFPFELPMNWVWTELNQISAINGGFAFKSSNYKDDGARVIRISDFDENGFKDHRVVRHEFSEDLKPYVLEKNNILIAMTGGTVGKSYFVDSLDEVMVVNQRVATIKLINLIDEKYINCVIPTSLVQDVIHEAKNSTNDNISMSDIKGFKIPIPPLQEQKAIVAIVEELFAEVEQLEQKTQERIQLKKDYVTSALHKLSQTTDVAKTWQDLQAHFATFFNEKANIKSLRESILQLAVQGKLTKNWREKLRLNGAEVEPATELLKRITAEKKKLIEAKAIKKEKSLPKITENEKPFELPDGWVWCRIKDIAYSIVPNRDKPKSFTGDITWLTTRNLEKQSNKIHLKSGDNKLSKKEIQEYNVRLFPSHSVVMSCVGQFGLSAVLNDVYSGNQQLHCFVPLCSVNPYFLDYLIKNGKETYYNMSSATTISYLNKTKCESLVIPLPPLEEQKAIVKIVDELMVYCDGLERDVEKRDNLLEDLMVSCLVEMENDSSYGDDMGELRMVAEEKE